MVRIEVCREKTDAVETIDNNVVVYPTIALSNVTVKSDHADGQIIVRNLQGQIVKIVPITNNKTEISVSNLHSGEYVLQIIENGNVTTKKIIIR